MYIPCYHMIYPIMTASKESLRQIGGWQGGTACAVNCYISLSVYNFFKKGNIISSEYRKKIKDWIRSEQKRIGCEICGYSKCSRVLGFHHTDPKTKNKNDGGRWKIRSWVMAERAFKECMVVCANCHGEIHAGLYPEYFEIPSLKEDKQLLLF